MGGNYQIGVAYRFWKLGRVLPTVIWHNFLHWLQLGISWYGTLPCASMSESGPAHHKERHLRQLPSVKPEQHFQALVFGKISPFPTVCVAFDDTGSPLQKTFCGRHFRSLSFKSRHYNQLEVCSDLFHGRVE